MRNNPAQLNRPSCAFAQFHRSTHDASAPQTGGRRTNYAVRSVTLHAIATACGFAQGGCDSLKFDQIVFASQWPSGRVTYEAILGARRLELDCAWRITS